MLGIWFAWQMCQATAGTCGPPKSTRLVAYDEARPKVSRQMTSTVSATFREPSQESETFVRATIGHAEMERVLSSKL